MKINIKLLVILCSVKVIFAIIGGKDAEVRRYRYMVSLRLFVRYPFCSGSIIDKYHVLTAGHCLDGKKQNEITIVAGTPYRRSEDGDYYYVKNMQAHKDYSFPFHDIGLIRVTPEIQFHSNVQLVPLPTEDIIQIDAIVNIAGWGNIDPQYPDLKARMIKELQQRVLDLTECKKYYNVWINHFCMHSKNGEGSCNGDSGGPVVFHEPGGGDVLVGVISGSHDPCGSHPGFSPKVYNYLSWIEMTKEEFKLRNLYYRQTSL